MNSNMEISVHGYREDLKKSFKSKMEANVARYYEYLKINWFYEPREYKFDKIKRGTLYYKPDFYLAVPTRLLIEVKGWFRRVDKIKLKRFKKYYPEEFSRLRFIIPDKYAKSKSNGEQIQFLCDVLKIDFNEIISYKEIEKVGKLVIPNWE